MGRYLVDSYGLVIPNPNQPANHIYQAKDLLLGTVIEL